jgi:hypothetical protein
VVAERLDFEATEDSEFNSTTTLMLAACGNLGARRAMANRAYEQFLAFAGEGHDVAAIALAECLTYTRLPVLQGTARAGEILVFVLAKFGEWQAERGRKDIGERLDAISLNLADALADERHDAMAGIVGGCRGLPAETLEKAKRLRRTAPPVTTDARMSAIVPIVPIVLGAHRL